MYSINILESDQFHLVRLTHWIEWHLCSIYLWLVSQFVPPRSFLNCRIVSQLHPSPISPYPRLKMCSSTQSRSHPNPIQALRFTFLLCLSWILPQSGSWYLHLAYIQVTPHPHPGPPNCILIPSKHHLKPIQVSRCHPIPVSRSASHLNPGPISTPSRLSDSRLFFVSVESYLSLAPDICISPTSR